MYVKRYTTRSYRWGGVHQNTIGDTYIWLALCVWADISGIGHYVLVCVGKEFRYGDIMLAWVCFSGEAPLSTLTPSYPTTRPNDLLESHNNSMQHALTTHHISNHIVIHISWVLLTSYQVLVSRRHPSSREMRFDWHYPTHVHKRLSDSTYERQCPMYEEYTRVVGEECARLGNNI